MVYLCLLLSPPSISPSFSPFPLSLPPSLPSLYLIILNLLYSIISTSHVQRLMGISYVDFVKDPAIALLFRQAVLSALAINELPLSSVQIAYFYGQVSGSEVR